MVAVGEVSSSCLWALVAVVAVALVVASAEVVLAAVASAVAVAAQAGNRLIIRV
jgi:hypothetical protein